jgi:DNA replicative helicase MCM subunit Mcm2 (Cdc46/Mcm family)
MSTKPHIEKFYCESCESSFKVTFKEDEVSRNPIFCCFCSTELDFDNPVDAENEDNNE